MYTKFVEVGRIAFIAFGASKGQIGCIVDVIDQNRVSISINEVSFVGNRSEMTVSNGSGVRPSVRLSAC